MKLFSLLLVLAITGCATAAKLNEISLGMTKQQVISILGNPSSTSAAAGVEYMKYNFYRESNGVGGISNTDHFVRIKGGLVESYGKMGDFDSTKPEETKSTIDLNINQ